MFAQAIDKILPSAFRVVVDGDIVSGVPPPGMGYKHNGTEILIDSIGAGSIIVDPSFVERRLRTQYKSSVRVHSLLVYRKGLLGVKESAEFIRSYARSLPKGHQVDPIRMALFAGHLLSDSYNQNIRSMQQSQQQTEAGVQPSGDGRGGQELLPTSSSHAEEEEKWRPPRAIDVSESKYSSVDSSTHSRRGQAPVISYSPNADSDIAPKDSTFLMEPSSSDEVYHHNADVTETEEMVANRRRNPLLQSLAGVVPFRPRGPPRKTNSQTNRLDKNNNVSNV